LVVAGVLRGRVARGLRDGPHGPHTAALVVCA